jgi:electron transfer flavoprotein beta subunit
MKIAVCIKQVPAAASVKIDPETHRIIREGVETVVNPYDLYALQWALELRERTGAPVAALCMGPRSAKNSLYEAYAFGVDEAYLLTDKKFGGSDTLVTSTILANGIKKIGDVGIVLCGKQAIDGDTAQVGPGIAAHLGWSQATCVTKIGDISSDSVIVQRMFEHYTDRAECRLPAVLAVEKAGIRPRVPTLKDWLKAVERPITQWGAETISVEESELGLNGSPTKVVRTNAATFGDKETTVIEGSPEQLATRLFIELARRGLY